MPRPTPTLTSVSPLVAKGTRWVAVQDVATTRLQLRWVVDDREECQFRCYYELVLGLDAPDVRREQFGPRGGRRPDRKALVVPISDSGRNSNGRPCSFPTPQGEMLHYDAPRYDGCHAEWDAAKLGGLPIYVITLDGVYLQDDPPVSVGKAEGM